MQQGLEAACGLLDRFPHGMHCDAATIYYVLIMNRRPALQPLPENTVSLGPPLPSCESELPSSPPEHRELGRSAGHATSCTCQAERRDEGGNSVALQTRCRAEGETFC
ncbi:hypothetical protein H920_16580 [Fukomys damarensis]|uniref:Uncharacterized protein n=1 Tax=Fukomys damarensis TaxID=885580 RepID=A0A091CU88_FUKDA|nr:hypothetical protein H920_16580 [Fukomys damarensis]